MDAVLDLIHNLVTLFWSVLNVVVALVYVILPWLPLLAWIGFWMFAVNWVRAFEILRKGGFIGVLLLMFAAVLIWGAVDPPADGSHHILKLTVSNYPGKFIYVTMLTCIALLCGSAQMNGFASQYIDFSDEEEEPADTAAHAH